MTQIGAATDFERELLTLATPEQRQKYTRYFPGDDSFAGVRMGDVFALAGRALAMPVGEIETLLESPIHEVRVGACSIMGKAASHRAVTGDRHRELYELYLRRHDRIDTWDLVDLGAYQVVGSWLVDAGSSFWPERRTAIVATAAFLRRRDITDTLRLARRLGFDENEYVQKATGWMLRTAGEVNREALLGYLDETAATLPRLTLRAATEKLDRSTRAGYLAAARAR
jgi:hypothetical protein